MEKELDDYFIACEARVFSREAPDRLRKVESTIDLLNNQAIRDFFTSAPVAEPRPDETLDFSAKLNPLKRDALLAFAADAHIGEFLVGNTLSNDNWKKLKAPVCPVCRLGCGETEQHIRRVTTSTACAVRPRPKPSPRCAA